MPRIYKGTAATLKLLIPTCPLDSELTDVSVTLYTDPKDGTTVFTKNIEIDGNILTLEFPAYAFTKKSDGVINYIVKGKLDGEQFLVQRQSNYFLKTPDGFDAEAYPIPGDVKVTSLEATITENGTFSFKPETDEHFNPIELWEGATIEVNVPAEEGGSCNLGEGALTLTTNDVGTYEMYSSDEGYDGWSKFIVTLESGGAIKIHKASDLLDTFNNGGNIDYGTYYYVGGQITEIQEVSTQYGNATYTLDNGFQIYRGDWMNGDTFTSEDQIKVGAYIVVYGIIQDYNGTLQFKAHSQVIAYQECEGGEIVSCNLEDKWVTPSMGDRDDNGLIVVNPSEGYDGLSRTVIDPTTIYNEGKAEGGGGSCNLGLLDWTLDNSYGSQKNASDDGYDGYSVVVVRPENIITQEKENAINEYKNQMEEITITENGTYSIDDQEIRHYIEFDGNSYFDTNIPFGENTKIEVAITKTTWEEDEQVIGVAHYDLSVADTYGGFGIVLGAGLTYGVFGQTKTGNIPFSYEKEQILTLDISGIHSSLDNYTGNWEDDSKLDASGLYEQTIGIGKIKSMSDGWSGGFNGRIRYVKIWTNKDDDSTMTLFRPKNMAQGGFGLVNSEGTEYNYVENIGDGTTTFVEEYVNIYPYGFKRVEVNVVSPFTTQEISYSDYQNMANYDNNTIYLISE